MIAVPHCPLDLDGLRQWADRHGSPPDDPEVLRVEWRQLISDVLALVDHVETLEYARRAA